MCIKILMHIYPILAYHMGSIFVKHFLENADFSAFERHCENMHKVGKIGPKYSINGSTILVGLAKIRFMVSRLSPFRYLTTKEE